MAHAILGRHGAREAGVKLGRRPGGDPTASRDLGPRVSGCVAGAPAPSPEPRSSAPPEEVRCDRCFGGGLLPWTLMAPQTRGPAVRLVRGLLASGHFVERRNVLCRVPAVGFAENIYFTLSPRNGATCPAGLPGVVQCPRVLGRVTVTWAGSLVCPEALPHLWVTPNLLLRFNPPEGALEVGCDQR